MSTRGQDSAYPAQEDPVEYGLTKRELFAAMAMQGLVTDLDRSKELAEVLEAMKGLEIGSMENARSLRSVIAKMAVGHADALIAELNKETP